MLDNETGQDTRCGLKSSEAACVADSRYRVQLKEYCIDRNRCIEMTSSMDPKEEQKRERYPAWPQGNPGIVLADCILGKPVQECVLLMHGGENDFRVRV